MSKLTFYKPPEIQKGYVLNPQKSFFSVVIPEETTNLIYNPETQHLNDFAAIGDEATIELDLDEILFGTSSIHASLFQDDYVEHDLIVTLTPDTIYTFSVYLKGTGSIRLGVYNETLAEMYTLGSVINLRSDLWTRHILKFTTPALGVMENSNLHFIGVNSHSNFWISGLQLEQKAYATTFCSGNQLGLITGESPKPYFWVSTPNYSPSVRLLTTRDGGKIVSLETLGFQVTGFSGLGLPEFDIISSPIANGVGSIYQGSIIEERDIEICGVLMSPTVKDFFCNRAGLAHSFRPNIASVPQPIKMIYSVYECEKQICEQVEMLAVYESGLEGQIESLLGEEICISLKMLDPLFKGLGNEAKTLNVFKEVEEGRGIVGTDINGEWQEMDTEPDEFGGMFGSPPGIIEITVGPDNNLYIGGVSDISGISNGTMVARWNGTSFDSIGQAYAADGVTLAGGAAVEVIIPGPDNMLYVGGTFKAIGNVNGVISVADGDGANTADADSYLNIARYNISTNTWHYIGRFLDEVNFINAVRDMKLLHDGVINTATLNGKIMIVGQFANPEGIDETVFSNSKNIILYNPETELFELAVPMGNNDLAGIADSTINSIDQAPNGEIWIGGDFEFDGNLEISPGVYLNIVNVAVWGRSPTSGNDYLGFEGVSGVLANQNIIGGPVRKVLAGPDGTVYIGGSFSATQIYDDINPDYPPHITVNDTVIQNGSAVFGFAQVPPGNNTQTWYTPFILGSMGWESGDPETLGEVYDMAFDNEGNIHIVGTFTFANTYFPNEEYLDSAASASSHTVIDALATQTVNCNGYMIWDGSNFIQPDIYFISEYDEFLDAADPITISGIELGALYSNRFSEHSSSPNPNNFEYHLPGTGGSNISPSFDRSIFLAVDNPFHFVSKDIEFIDLECNDFAKPIFVINGPGKLKSIINETTGDAIYFNYDMIEGEALVLDLTQPLFTLFSNYRGNLRSIINPNSTISSFNLTGETLAISVNLDLLLVGENTNTSFMKWKKQYWSVDKACGCDCGELGTYDE